MTEHVHALPRASGLGQAVRTLAVVVAVVVAVFGAGDPFVDTFSLIFVGIVLEAMPFMLLGSLVSGLVEVFFSRDRLAALLPRRRLATTLLTACAGLLFPVCECAVVPVVRRFLRKGLPASAAIAYLLAGPIVNPIVGASTAVAYLGGPGEAMAAFVALRLGAGLVVAVLVGLLAGRIAGPLLLAREQPPASEASDSGVGSSRLLAAVRHGADEFLEVGPYLVLGAFVAALAQTVVSRSAFLDLAGTPLLAVLLMMAMALLLNLCSEADAFVAASFRASLPATAQLSFLVLGPMLDLKLLAMYLGVFRRRAILVLIALVLAAVLAATLGLGALGVDGWLAARGIGPEVAP